MIMFHSRIARATLLGIAAGLALPATTQAAVFTIDSGTASANNRQTFNPATDVWQLDVSDFAVGGPLVFASAAGGNPGLLGTLDDSAATFDNSANVIVIRNFDNNDTDGFPANWDDSFNARNALRAIANNTDGDRAGFFLYWNEKLGVNRLVYTTNLNDGDASLQVLFAINSLNLFANSDDLAPDSLQALRQEANANFNALASFSAANFTAVPVPAALPLMLGAVAALRLKGRRVV